MKESRRQRPGEHLRAEFGTRALTRTLAGAAVRVLAFVGLGILGSHLLIG